MNMNKLMHCGLETQTIESIQLIINVRRHIVRYSEDAQYYTGVGKS